jgi:hypothetical protein
MVNMHAAARRPENSEYAEYFDRYIQWIKDPDVLDVLERQRHSIESILGGLSEEQGNQRYAPGKWSVKELMGHVIDTERVFAYRALRFARNDATALAGFDQDAFALHANYANIPLQSIAAEFEAVRHATLLLFRHLQPEAWDRHGISNKNELSVRAAAYVIAGHAQHHLEILKSKYMVPNPA